MQTEADYDVFVQRFLGDSLVESYDDLISVCSDVVSHIEQTRRLGMWVIGEALWRYMRSNGLQDNPSGICHICRKVAESCGKTYTGFYRAFQAAQTRHNIMSIASRNGHNVDVDLDRLSTWAVSEVQSRVEGTDEVMEVLESMDQGELTVKGFRDVMEVREAGVRVPIREPQFYYTNDGRIFVRFGPDSEYYPCNPGSPGWVILRRRLHLLPLKEGEL